MKLRIPTCNRLLAITVLAAALGGATAQAQKIAIVSMQQAVLATSDGKKAAVAIDAKFAPLKAQLEQLQKDIIAKQNQLTKNGSTMTPAAVTAAQTEIQSLTTALKRKQEDAQQDLQDEESKQLGGIVPRLTQVINAYAVANQITFVVDTSASPNNLVYADGKINITAAIVEGYEKAAGAPAATTPAKTPATAPKAPATTTTTPKPAAPPSNH